MAFPLKLCLKRPIFQSIFTTEDKTGVFWVLFNKAVSRRTCSSSVSQIRESDVFNSPTQMCTTGPPASLSLQVKASALDGEGCAAIYLSQIASVSCME